MNDYYSTLLLLIFQEDYQPQKEAGAIPNTIWRMHEDSKHNFWNKIPHRMSNNLKIAILLPDKGWSLSS